MPIRQITYTYHLDDKYTAAQLAKWVLEKARYSQFTLADALMIARSLKNGFTWKPEYYTLHEPEFLGPCQFEIVDVKTEHELQWEEQCATHARHAELLKLGAAGNAEAAIAYCKAAQENENFFLRAAYAGSAA